MWSCVMTPLSTSWWRSWGRYRAVLATTGGWTHSGTVSLTHHTHILNAHKHRLSIVSLANGWTLNHTLEQIKEDLVAKERSLQLDNQCQLEVKKKLSEHTTLAIYTSNKLNGELELPWVKLPLSNDYKRTYLFTRNYSYVLILLICC